jgi:predicted MFS family arabinose efflux permease
VSDFSAASRGQKRKAATLLFGGFVAMAVAMGIGRFFYTPLLPLMQRQLHFGPDVAGLIASVNFIGYFLGSVSAAFIPRGPMRLLVFRVALVASILTTFATGLTESLPLWLVLRGIAGTASAFVFLFSAAIVAEALTAAGKSEYVGWLFGGVGVGIALSGLIVRAAGGVLDWSRLWMVAGVLCALAAPFIWSAVRDTALAVDASSNMVARRIPRPLPLWALLVNYTCEGFGYSIMATFIVAIVKARPGMESIGDWVWVVVGLAGLPSTILWSRLAERIGYAFALALAYVAQLVGILLPVASRAPSAALLAAILFGGTFMAITALVLALGREAAKGQGFAVLGQILGPLMAGYLAEGQSAGFNGALLVSAGVIFAGFLFLALAVMQARERERMVNAR